MREKKRRGTGGSPYQPTYKKNATRAFASRFILDEVAPVRLYALKNCPLLWHSDVSGNTDSFCQSRGKRAQLRNRCSHPNFREIIKSQGKKINIFTIEGLFVILIKNDFETVFISIFLMIYLTDYRILIQIEQQKNLSRINFPFLFFHPLNY